ncbi:hypothetical protein M408DRAFT_330089 [Serendipita vermifera MAFF 305830]|uniref:Uncharacterized protein n=1 Tax=Serendipita vermifera MAFF 305830 TaxID=933852 RepID=A0A0C2XE47_SERVB|nr:hypothetical protein M408DRAFT_330089 [Serendipita vermifera MAFF 305830]
MPRKPSESIDTRSYVAILVFEHLNHPRNARADETTKFGTLRSFGKSSEGIRLHIKALTSKHISDSREVLMDHMV